MTGPSTEESPPVIPQPRTEQHPRGVLSAQDEEWIVRTVAALPPPTEEEIIGWCDIIAHARAQRRRNTADE